MKFKFNPKVVHTRNLDKRYNFIMTINPLKHIKMNKKITYNKTLFL